MISRNAVRLLFALCAFSVTLSVFASHGGTSRNVYGIFPDDRHAPADVREKLSPKYVRVEVVWSENNPQPAILRFDRASDEKIAAIEAAGMRAFPTLIVGRGWMNGLLWPPDAGVPRSAPPGDLRSTFDPNFGYSEWYFNFVRDYMRHYSGHFDSIAIEHQIDNAGYWAGTVDEYLRLLRTAYMAIKSVDANVVVTNAGFDSALWGEVIAKDWMTRGTRTKKDAIEFVLQYSVSEQPIGSVRPELQVRETIESSLDDPNSDFNRRRLPMVNKILDGLAGSVDAINLHYHHDARFLFTVAEWLRERMTRTTFPYVQRILTSDLAITATPDLACGTAEHFSPRELDRHARMLFKRLIAARLAALEVVVVAAIETVCDRSPLDPNHVDLFDPARPGELRPAGEAFRRFVDATSAGRSPRVFSAGPELFALWFDDVEGRQALLAIWSEVPGGQEFTLLVSRAFTSALITDYAGNSQRVPVVNGDLRLSIDSTPVLVHLLLPDPPLSISTVSPSSGSTAGGTPIAITGTSFMPGATVKIGAAFARNVRVVSSTRIEAETPPHARETVNVVVTNPDGSSTQLSNAFTYVEGLSRRRRAGRR